MKYLPQLIALTIAILAGSIYVYLSFIDGVYIDRPITFIRDTNPDHLLLERNTYKAGETPRLYSAFCKNREFESTIQWYLLNGQQTTYSPRKSERSGLPIGCYPDSPLKKITYPLEKIPDDHDKTCDAYFAGVSKNDIGGGRIREQHYKTQKFCITR